MNRTSVQQRLLWLAATGLLVLGLGTLPRAQAAAVLDIDGNGQLLGAAHVSVAGVLYDVYFSDLTGQELFEQPDGSYAFGPVDDLNKALFSTALAEQVLVGAFDERPELTAGCEALDECRLYTAFRTFSPGNIGASVAVNLAGVGPSPLLSSGNPFPTDRFDALVPGQGQPNTPRPDAVVWAVWSTAQAVPAPGALGLLVLALLPLWQAQQRVRSRTGAPV